MAVREYQAIKYDGGTAGRVTDALTLEEALQINVNGSPFTITMRTPGNDLELVRGLLNSESVLSAGIPNPAVLLHKEEDGSILTIADVNIPEEDLAHGITNSRNLLSVSSCGICGKTELDDFSSMQQMPTGSVVLDSHRIPELFRKMQSSQNAFMQSGGSHAAAAFDHEGNLLVVMEDIGRHNAVDKVVGSLLMSGNPGKASFLLVSGRISYEIVVKVFKARIPVLCAVSAPSSLAVDYAKELGITLLAFCRGDRATCYAHPERIYSSTPGQMAV